MTSPGGQWIRVRFADGSRRLDWIPDEQAPSPDGSVGLWHVVPDPAGAESRWEWHPRAAPPVAEVLAASAFVSASVFAPGRMEAPDLTSGQVAPAVAAAAPAPVAAEPPIDPADAPTSVFAPISPATMPPAPDVLAAAMSAPDSHHTQPLPLQVVPNRPLAGAPSVFATPRGKVRGPKEARAQLPKGMRVAAVSLSVVLAVPVVYLLAQHSKNHNPLATAAQSGPVSQSDEAATAAGALGAEATEAGPDGASSQTPEPSSADATVATNQQYLGHLYNLDATEGYTFTALGDAYLLSTGNQACTDLDNGATYEAVRQRTMLAMPNGGQILVAAATTYLCPRHHPKLVDFTARQPTAQNGSGTSTATAQPGPPSQTTGTTTAPDSTSDTAADSAAG